MTQYVYIIAMFKPALCNYVRVVKDEDNTVMYAPNKVQRNFCTDFGKYLKYVFLSIDYTFFTG